MYGDVGQPLTVSDFKDCTPGDIIPVTSTCYNPLPGWGLKEDRFLVRFEGVEVTPDGKFNILCSFNDTGRLDDWSDVGPYLYEFEGVVCAGSGADSIYRLF